MAYMLDTGLLTWRAEPGKPEQSIEIAGPDSGLTLSVYLDDDERSIIGVLVFDQLTVVAAAGRIPVEVARGLEF